MKFLIAPDSFKGSMDAATAAAAIAAGVSGAESRARYDLLPISDGGEGLLSVLAGPLELEMLETSVRGPLGDRVVARWGWNEDRRLAVVEVAEAVGIDLIPPWQRDIFAADSFGVGELMNAARERGAERIVIGLGGSGTSDGGAGLLRALGLRLLDRDGDDREGAPRELQMVVGIDFRTLETWSQVDILVASDVDNPLTGPTGAAAVFSPQKGATEEDAARLEKVLAGWGRLLQTAPFARWQSADRQPETKPAVISEMPGAGAAGGIGAALLALGARLRPGIEVVLEVTGFADRLDGVDCVLTGEGRIDSQTRFGKAPWGVCQAARRQGVPTVAFCGQLGEGGEALTGPRGFAAVVEISPSGESLEVALDNGPANLRTAARRVVESRIWGPGRRGYEGA